VTEFKGKLYVGVREFYEKVRTQILCTLNAACVLPMG
jgi:hypothetical protein